MLRVSSSRRAAGLKPTDYDHEISLVDHDAARTPPLGPPTPEPTQMVRSTTTTRLLDLDEEDQEQEDETSPNSDDTQVQDGDRAQPTKTQAQNGEGQSSPVPRPSIEVQGMALRLHAWIFLFMFLNFSQCLLPMSRVETIPRSSPRNVVKNESRQLIFSTKMREVDFSAELPSSLAKRLVVLILHLGVS